tara:strand:+ start:1914 stop:2144 length:231 start_codon:yes stop_codon:yes gene_type:complete
MKRNELKQKYHKETLCYYKDKNELINKEYMNWLEDELIKQLTLTDVVASKCVHKAKLLTNEEVAGNRSNAYKYLEL